MKKTVLFLFAILALGLASSFGQKMYTQVSIGYGLPVGTQSFGSDLTESVDQNDDNISSEKSVNGSLGSGINFNGAFGIMFSPFIGLDVNVNYLLGNKYTTSYNYNDVDANGSVLNQSKQKTTIQSSGYFISPTLVVNISGEKFSPYGKLGVVVGSIDVKNDGSTTWATSGTIYQTSIYEEKTTGEMTFGIRGGIGVTYQLKNNLSLYGEGIYTGMNYQAKESEITKLEIDGNDLLREYFPGDTNKTLYVKELHEYVYDPNNPYPKQKELQTPSPLSSFTFNFGIRISFGGI